MCTLAVRLTAESVSRPVGPLFSILSAFVMRPPPSHTVIIYAHYITFIPNNIDAFILPPLQPEFVPKLHRTLLLSLRHTSCLVALKSPVLIYGSFPYIVFTYEIQSHSYDIDSRRGTRFNTHPSACFTLKSLIPEV